MWKNDDHDDDDDNDEEEKFFLCTLLALDIHTLGLDDGYIFRTRTNEPTIRNAMKFLKRFSFALLRCFSAWSYFVSVHLFPFIWRMLCGVFGSMDAARSFARSHVLISQSSKWQIFRFSLPVYRTLFEIAFSFSFGRHLFRIQFALTYKWIFVYTIGFGLHRHAQQCNELEFCIVLSFPFEHWLQQSSSVQEWTAFILMGEQQKGAHSVLFSIQKTELYPHACLSFIHAIRYERFGGQDHGVWFKAKKEKKNNIDD